MVQGLCKCNPSNVKLNTLIFKRDELLYDLKNLCWIEGDVMRTDDEHQRHPVIDIGEEGNVDRVTRLLNLYFAKVVEILYPITKVEVVDQIYLDDRFIEPGNYIGALHLPEDFSQTTVFYLLELIHNYLVDMVMWDWLSITNPDVADKWYVKAEQLVDEMKSALTKRRKALRRKLHPF